MRTGGKAPGRAASASSKKERAAAAALEREAAARTKADEERKELRLAAYAAKRRLKTAESTHRRALLEGRSTDAAKALQKIDKAKREIEQVEMRRKQIRQDLQAVQPKERQEELLKARVRTARSRAERAAKMLKAAGCDAAAAEAQTVATHLNTLLRSGLPPLVIGRRSARGQGARESDAATAELEGTIRRARALEVKAGACNGAGARVAVAEAEGDVPRPLWVGPNQPLPESWPKDVPDPRITELSPALRDVTWLLILPEAGAYGTGGEIPPTLVATIEHPVGVVVIRGQEHQPALVTFVREPTQQYMKVQEHRYPADAETGTRRLTAADVSLDILADVGELGAGIANHQGRQAITSGLSYSHGPRRPLGGQLASVGPAYACNTLRQHVREEHRDRCEQFDGLLGGASVVFGRLFSALLPAAYTEYASIVRVSGAALVSDDSRNPLAVGGLARFNVTARAPGCAITFGAKQHIDADVRASADLLGAASLGLSYRVAGSAEEPWEFGPPTIRPMACWAPRGKFKKPSFFELEGFGLKWELTDTDVMVAWRGGVKHGTAAGEVADDKDNGNDVFGMSAELSNNAAKYCLERQRGAVATAHQAASALRASGVGGAEGAKRRGGVGGGGRANSKRGRSGRS